MNSTPTFWHPRGGFWHFWADFARLNGHLWASLFGIRPMTEADIRAEIGALRVRIGKSVT
jgi:hypothetical protein